MIIEGAPELDKLYLFLSDTVLSEDVKIKGDVSLYLKSLTHHDKDSVLQMRNQNIYWNEKVNEYLRSNINEDNEEISFLFDKRDDIIFVISCLEDIHPEFNLRDKPLPPFALVKKGEVEELCAEIRDNYNRHMSLLRKEWEDRYEDDLWLSLKASLDKVVNLEESSMYWYLPNEDDMDPYEWMDDEYVVGNRAAYCFFVNPLKNCLVALEYAFVRKWVRINLEEEEENQMTEDEDIW